MQLPYKYGKHFTVQVSLNRCVGVSGAGKNTYKASNLHQE